MQGKNALEKGYKMNELQNQKCTACRPDAPKATKEEIEKYMKLLPGWELVNENNIDQIAKVFTFDDYQSAVDFTNKVAEEAESEGHHPAIILEWGKSTVKWWTHKIEGLHINDFIMASKTEHIYNSRG